VQANSISISLQMCLYMFEVKAIHKEKYLVKREVTGQGVKYLVKKEVPV